MFWFRCTAVSSLVTLKFRESISRCCVVSVVGFFVSVAVDNTPDLGVFLCSSILLLLPFLYNENT